MGSTSSGAGAYPISVRFDRDQRIGRLWGIPFLGWFVRAVILIPHFIILSIFGIVVSLVMLVAWIPVLVNGAFPGWGYDIVGGYYRWSVRVSAYLLLMAGRYPPLGTDPGYAVEVDFDRSTRLNRLWGIPLLGMFVRTILVIPHAIALWIVGLVAGIIIVFSWIPVLLFGRYPALGYEIVGGYLRWSTRVTCWVLLMAGPYPPFRLGD